MNEDSIDQHKAKLLSNMKHVTVGQSGAESKCQREVLWHINVDFLEDRLHIGVLVLHKLGLRTVAGLSKSHKAGLFVLTSKFLAECHKTENGHSSLNLNASCKATMTRYWRAQCCSVCAPQSLSSVSAHCEACVTHLDATWTGNTLFCSGGL